MLSKTLAVRSYEKGLDPRRASASAGQEEAGLPLQEEEGDGHRLEEEDETVELIEEIEANLRRAISYFEQHLTIVEQFGDL